MSLTAAAYTSTNEVKLMQEQKLQELLQHLNLHSPFYKELFGKYAIDISEVKTLDDLVNLPVTTKEDLQQRNDDFLCVPKRLQHRAL
jgi:phenylacetate-CoA ligase